MWEVQAARLIAVLSGCGSTDNPENCLALQKGIDLRIRAGLPGT